MREFLNRESIIYLVTALIAGVIVFAGLFYYISFVAKDKPQPAPEISLVEKQYEELDKLRGSAAPLTEEEVQDQFKELDKLRNK